MEEEGRKEGRAFLRWKGSSNGGYGKLIKTGETRGKVLS